MKEWICEEVPAVTIDGRVISTMLHQTHELIRCMDCKHRPELKLYSDRHGNYTAVEFPEGSKCPCQCEDFFYSWYPKDDWFCANGERKEDENSL